MYLRGRQIHLKWYSPKLFEQEGYMGKTKRGKGLRRAARYLYLNHNPNKQQPSKQEQKSGSKIQAETW
jgi:hypothetical protein